MLEVRGYACLIDVDGGDEAAQFFNWMVFFRSRSREIPFCARYILWTTTPEFLDPLAISHLDWSHFKGNEVCFFRQFVRSVPKVDYLTLRHGFITAHLAPHSATKFDFQKYIKRSLEDDFKVVVGIRMGLQIQERGDIVVKGVPIVLPADDHFWLNRPRLVLFLIHFVLFQNAFQLAFFVWTWYEFGLRSCFHKRLEDVIIRISMGVLIQILCSYVTLPLYALVTQMGSKMKPTIFNERVATALKKWHHTAKKHVKESRRSGSVTPLSMSRPATPSRNTSPVHLLRYFRGEADSLQASPRFYGSDNEGSTSPSRHTLDDFSSHHHDRQGPNELQERENNEVPSSSLQSLQEESSGQLEIKINSSSMDFSFAKR
ncbi:MLO-like protein 6 [Asimina triloba]